VLESGRPAPEFSLKDIAGKRRSLREELKSGPVLVVFFKISCPTCQLALPFLERIAGQVRTVGISQDDAPATKEFLEYFGITFPVLLDPAGERYQVSNAYRITNVPSLFLMEPDGRISWTLSGFHKGDLEALSARFGAVMFRESDTVPAMKPG
jgi:peroxiredoxin